MWGKLLAYQVIERGLNRGQKWYRWNSSKRSVFTAFLKYKYLLISFTHFFDELLLIMKWGLNYERDKAMTLTDRSPVFQDYRGISRNQ